MSACGAAARRRLGEVLGTPHSTDLAELMRKTGAQIGIVTVAYAANWQSGLMAAQHGLHVLLETPIALREGPLLLQ